MVRLILFLVLILFIIWILRPFLKTKNGDEKNNELENIMNSDKSTFRQPNTIFIVISVVLLFALFLWLLPKLGINFLSLFQKIVPLISTLRGILPF
jgi:quinol-cytochrome oxidoreductase complex cytochrome b subunit